MIRFPVAIVSCSLGGVLIFFSTAASKIHPAHVVSVIYPVRRIDTLYPVSRNWESSSGTFSGLLKVLGQQSSNASPLVKASIQPWRRFQGASRWRGTGMSVMFCQALLKLSSQKVVIVWAPSLLSERTHWEHSKEHADAYTTVHCWRKKEWQAARMTRLITTCVILTPSFLWRCWFLRKLFLIAGNCGICLKLDNMSSLISIGKRKIPQWIGFIPSSVCVMSPWLTQLLLAFLFSKLHFGKTQGSYT